MGQQFPFEHFFQNRTSGTPVPMPENREDEASEQFSLGLESEEADQTTPSSLEISDTECEALNKEFH